MENITLAVSCEPIFTRYLYIKPDVYVSLYTAIQDKKRDEALFWAYELYYSGWGYEMVGFLETHIAHHPSKIGRFIHTCINNWRVHKRDPLIATIVSAMIRNAAAYSTAKIVYINYSEKDIDEFQTVKTDPQHLRHWKVLQTVCVYATKKDGVNEDVSPLFGHHHCREEYAQFFRGEWEYYAYFTPIWKQRIETYGGEPDHTAHTIRWTKKEEITEMFYEKFGYEPDEQPLEVFHALIH